MIKRFDPALFAENDLKARTAVKTALEKSGYEILDNEKKRGVDLLVYKDGKHIANIETEIKRVWVGDSFQYTNVQFPQRKAKYAELDKPTAFVMWNNDQTSCIVVKGSDLLASPQVEVPNKYVYKGEFFFQVPIDKVKFNDILSVVKEITNVEK